jgi:ATP synthase protein I
MSDNDPFAGEVAAQAARKLAHEQAPRKSVWLGLGVVGVVGWSIVVPTLAGTALGAWMDRHRGDSHSWTLMLLIAGLMLGCANAWHWVSREMRDD